MPRASAVYRRAAGLGLFFCLFVPALSAQKFLKVPSVEVFGGYSYLRFDSKSLGFSDQLNLNGANVEISLPDLYQGFGITADVSGHYAREMEEFNFLIGPQYRREWKGMQVYGHVLFGRARDRLRLSGNSQIEPSSLGGAFAAGGGIDYPLGDKFSIRPIQADYLGTSAFGNTHNNVRLSTGIVFRFGKRPSEHEPSF